MSDGLTDNPVSITVELGRVSRMIGDGEVKT